ncbi:MAG: hypothetical protein ACOCPA_00725 [Segatella copri]
METKLNDNEVQTIAEMQKKIDSYESFISTVHAMVFARRTDLNYLVFDGTEFTNEMNRIWRFVKGKINADKQ